MKKYKNDYESDNIDVCVLDLLHLMINFDSSIKHGEEYDFDLKHLLFNTNYIFLILKKNKFEYLNIISSMDLSCFLGMIVAFTFLTKETLFLMKIVFRKKTNVNINVDSLRKKD